MVKQAYTNDELAQPDGRLVIERLLECDAANDPDCLLGRRFLCRGSGGLIVGTTGIGKSVFALQMMAQLAIGRDLFGISHPQKGTPIKIVVIQAENDAREVAEVLQCLKGKMSAKEVKLLEKNLVIYYDWEHHGEDFVHWIRKLANAHQADLVLIDPLMAYVDRNVSDNSKIAEFLRKHVNTMLKRKPEKGGKRFALLFVHHTTKSKKGGKGEDKSATELVYGLLGAAEIANWARCIISLELMEGAKGEGQSLCQLRIPKRGNRSGLIGKPTSGGEACRIRHAKPARGRTSPPQLMWEHAGDP